MGLPSSLCTFSSSCTSGSGEVAPLLHSYLTLEDHDEATCCATPESLNIVWHPLHRVCAIGFIMPAGIQVAMVSRD